MTILTAVSFLKLTIVLVVILFVFLSFCFYDLVILSVSKRCMGFKKPIEEIQKKSIVDQADCLDSISSTFAVDQSTEKRPRKQFSKSLLSSECKLELSQFFKKHFGAMAVQIDIEIKYRAIIRLILLHGTRLNPKDVMYLGWPKMSNSQKLTRKTASLRYLIFIITGEEVLPQIAVSIFNREWITFCEQNSLLAFSKKGNTPRLGYFVTHITFSNELKMAMNYHYLCTSAKRDCFDPITESDRRKCRVILSLKRKIMIEILRLTKIP